MDIQVLEVLPGERAIVSTRGLLRVIRADDSEPLQELVGRKEAEAFCRGYNAGRRRAYVIAYSPNASSTAAAS